jgi:hypothetical protein
LNDQIGTLKGKFFASYSKSLQRLEHETTEFVNRARADATAKNGIHETTLLQMQEAQKNAQGDANPAIAPAAPAPLHKAAISRSAVPMRSAPGDAAGAPFAPLPELALDPRLHGAAGAGVLVGDRNAYYSRDADATFIPHPRALAGPLGRAAVAAAAAAHHGLPFVPVRAVPMGVPIGDASVDLTGTAVARSAHWGRRSGAVSARHTLGLSARGGVVAGSAAAQEQLARAVLTPTQRVTAAVSALSLPRGGLAQDLGLARNPVTQAQIEATTRGLPANTNAAGVPYSTAAVAGAAHSLRQKRALAARALARSGVDIVAPETVLSSSNYAPTALDRQIHAIMHDK